MAIDAGAAHHNIVDDRKAAFTSNPFALAVFDAAVRQDGGLVKLDASKMKLLGERFVLLVEEVPSGSIDNLVRSVAEDVDDGIRGIEDVGTFREVYHREWQFAPNPGTIISLP